MPQVPRYTPQIEPGATPDTRMATGQSPALVGASAGDAAIRGAQGTTGLFSDMLEREARRADEQAAIADDLALSEIQDKLLYDPKNGAFTTMRGRSALGAPEYVQKGWTRALQGLEKQAMSRGRRTAFLNNVARRQAIMNHDMRLFVSGERQRDDNETTSAYRESVRMEAAKHWMTPGAVALDIARAENAIRSYGERNDRSPEWIEAEIAADRAAIHKNSINLMVQGGAIDRARHYYEEFGGELAPEERMVLEGAIEAGRIRVESGFVVEDAFGGQEIMVQDVEGQFTTERTPQARTWTEFLGRVRSDPRVKNDDALLAASEKLAKEAWEQVKVARAEQHDEYLLSVQAFVNRDKSLHNVPPEALASLSTEELSSLERRAKILRDNVDPETQWKLKLELDYRAELPENDPNFLGNMKPGEFEQYRPYFSGSDWDSKIQPLYSAAVAKKSSPGAASKWNGLMSEKERVWLAIQKSGIAGITQKDTRESIAKSGDAAKIRAVEHFERSAERRAKMIAGNETPTLDQIDKALDDVAREQSEYEMVEIERSTWQAEHWKQGSWFGANRTKSIREIDDEDIRWILLDEDEQHRFYYMWREGIVERLGEDEVRKRGLPLEYPTEFYRQNRETVNRAWLSWKRGQPHEKQIEILFGGTE